MSMIETIQQAIKSHDKYQIEIKLDYELLEAKRTRYQVLTFIFIPQNLGITTETYAIADFYRDIQNYIRLKTPTLILRDFTKYSTSPLVIVEKTTSIENWTTDPEWRNGVINNLKFLSDMIKSSIREHFNLINQRISEAASKSKTHLVIHNLVEEFLVETQKITDKYRAFFPVFNLPNVDQEVFRAYQYTDESISILIEESLVEMFQIVERYLKKSDKVDFEAALTERVEAEIKYRKAHGYRCILKAGKDNEAYIFRSSMLKKYASSVLYLSTAVHREGIGLEQFSYAIAAGLSMIFATTVAFYFQQRYGNLTFAFFAALVVGYMFKDRIKELVRALFDRYLSNHLLDRRTVIKTQDGKHKLGILKEKVSFVGEKDLPEAVFRIRNKGQLDELDNDGQTERIICYAKEITLFTEAFKKIYADTPLTGINDIIRYDIRAYLKKMADPTQERNYLQDGQLKTALCQKIYYLNFVSQYMLLTPKKAKLYKRLRLVLNRDGIKRTERIPV
jgi:hypothetical protein